MTDDRPELAMLLIPDCPHADTAHALLREALDHLGLHETSYAVTVIDSDDEARALGFLGSPTFEVDGQDLFPGPGDAGLSCRVYDGSGLPDADALRDALAAHLLP